MKYPNIEAERARAGLNRTEFAKAMGVGRKTVYNWVESGNIPSGALIQMGDMFGVSIDYLLGRTTTMRGVNGM